MNPSMFDFVLLVTNPSSMYIMLLNDLLNDCEIPYRTWVASVLPDVSALDGCCRANIEFLRRLFMESDSLCRRTLDRVESEYGTPSPILSDSREYGQVSWRQVSWEVSLSLELLTSVLVARLQASCNDIP